ncbi:MAG: AI-2E family transporter [Candidatus Moraniibacteriota bacterium]
MKLSNLNVYFFFGLMVGIGWLAFLIFKPFLTAILAAAVLAALFQSTYQNLLRKTNESEITSGLLSILFIIVIVFVPLFAILGVSIKEASSFFQSFSNNSGTSSVFVEHILNSARNLPYAETIFGQNAFNMASLVESLRGLGGNLLGFVEILYMNVEQFVVWTFIMFFTLFYFFIDGKTILAEMMRLSPLKNEHEALLMQKFVSMSRATLRITVIIGFIQGFLGTIMFFVAGVPSAILWGLLMAVMSVVPAVGSALVWMPAAIILIALGNVWQGVFVLVVGGGVISIVDNILRPKLVGKDTEMHPLMVFFATLGGISLFGFPGFVIGPIIMSLFLALGEIYAIEFRGQLQAYNK